MPDVCAVDWNQIGNTVPAEDGMASQNICQTSQRKGAMDAPRNNCARPFGWLTSAPQSLDRLALALHNT